MFSSPQAFGPRKALTTAYRDVGVETMVDGATPHKLVSMLYQHLSGEIGRARNAIKRSDVLVKCQAIGKAIAIVQEGLDAPLDMERGGDIAANLRDLYEYIVQRLTLANLKNDDAILAECGQLVDTLRDGWDRIAAQANAASAAPASI